jgi:ABC-type Na+ transport system ATPase subunit NatA
MKIVEFSDVGKQFRRRGQRLDALRDLSFTAAPGEAIALVGPNGAGKSTALRIAAGLLIPSGGRAVVCGFDVRHAATHVRRRVGVSLGAERSFYVRLTAKMNLAFFGRLAGLRGRELSSAVDCVADELDLGPWLNMRAGRLSRGTGARLAVARAFLGAPSLLLLDEPFASLDITGRALVCCAIERRLRDGCALVMATHRMEESRFCEQIVELPSPVSDPISSSGMSGQRRSAQPSTGHA